MRAALTSEDQEELARHERARWNRLGGIRERRLEATAKVDPARAEVLRERWLVERQKKLSGHSGEYGTLIIHSAETGEPRVVYGNVANHGLIDNLPQGCCVEVPCLVDKSGLQPVRVGTLPPH